MLCEKFKHFYFWCQKVLPLVYDNSLSYYEVLCKVVDRLNTMIDALNATNTQVNENVTNINELQEDVKELQEILDDIKNGKYIDLYLDSLSNAIQDIIAKIVKYVFFGLTDDGYFAAYIPQAWTFIRFSTDMDYNSNTYGHLQLYY